MTHSPLKLYAHAPSTLLPLLRTQLPYTLVLIATILANRHSDDTSPSPPLSPDTQVPPPLPPVYATFPPRVANTDAESESEAEAITPEYLSSLGIGAHDWLIAVALPVPSEQIRFYHSLVAAPTQLPEEVERAEGVVEGALREMVQLYPEQLVSGGTHELWEEITRRVLGGRKQMATLIYRAPEGGFGHTEIDTSGVKGWEGELVLDHGRESDKGFIFKLNHYRLEEYYGARAAHITLLRPRTPLPDRSPAPPEVFVQCHGDGSLGALHTQPAFRRRGLAKVVLAAHLAKYEPQGVPGFCYIEEYNTASIALFESLGWTRMPWNVYWVYERSVQESGCIDMVE